MGHLRLRRLPARALPVGATSTTDGAEVLVEGDGLAEWRLEALRAGELTLEDCLGSGEGPAERTPVVVSAAAAAALDELVALPANATVTQLRAVQTRAKAAHTRSS